MSHYDYKVSQEISQQEFPFYALIMAAIRKADDRNLHKLELVFPSVVAEFKDRYNAPDGVLIGD